MRYARETSHLTRGPRAAVATGRSRAVRWEETMFILKGRLVFWVLLVALLIISSTGCSVFMAAKQPDTKNAELFKVGTPRSMLLAEFGLPTVSEVRDGKKYEVFKFVQGYSTGAKVGRAMFHGVADVFTLGLWEIVGTPIEGVFSGDEMAYEVSYDGNDRIDQVTALKK